ncbi:hypothetical protein GCM10022280_20780 [Sphingomonas swuensis]|uniref:Uncharacterized protein n=1 Tax=Sphingomonas swuensis TaxID=977800 RepID=A0ABP7T2W0_9SPHN
MFALLMTAAAASSLTPTVEVMPRQFNRDGVRAVYTREIDSDGTVHLRGFYRDTARTRFHYRISGSHVEASVDGVADRFKVPTARP